MEDVQNPVTPDNSQVSDVTTGAADTGAEVDTINSVMNAISGDAGPGSEPAASGEKDEGTTSDDVKKDNPKWMSQLDKESLNNADFIKQLGKFQNISDLAKGYSELEKKLGNSVTIPGSDASEEEARAFYQKLGVPETADGYSITDEGSEKYKEIAFKNNLTDAQARAVYKAFQDIGRAAIEQNKANLEAIGLQTTKELKSEWGTDYKVNLEFMKRGIANYGGKTIVDKLSATGLIYDKDFCRMFAEIGRAASEAGATTRGTGGAKDYIPTSEGGHLSYENTR